MESQSAQSEPLSKQLEVWLKSKRHKTLAGLDEVFQDKSFAITFLVLMILPALPLPTGGITYVFELIVIFMCLELMVGRITPWLPKKWKHMRLGKTFTGKVIPTILKWIRWFEKRSTPRGLRMFTLPLFPRLFGLVVLIFTLAALLAPPFTGLDTLPSLGVVMVSLAVMLDDFLLFIVGVVTGTVGVVLTVVLGLIVVSSTSHFL